MTTSIKLIFPLILSFLTVHARSQTLSSGNVPSNPNLIDSAIQRYNQFTDDNIVYEFSLPDNNDKLVKLSDFRNKVVLFNFWYTSCGPCLAQIPFEKILFEKLKKEYKDVVWINISIDGNLQHWKDFIIRNELPGVHLISLNGGIYGANPLVCKLLKVQSFPHYALIDKNGKLIGHNLPRPSAGFMLEYQIYRALKGVKSGDAAKEIMTGLEPGKDFLLKANKL